MPQVINGNQIKLDDGKIVQAQQGGWYNGRQFWGGTLSSAGQINPQSNQVGAGQQVSREVVAQTNPANADFLKKQSAAFQNTQQVQDHLNQVQNATFQNYNSPDTPQVQTTAQIAADLKASGLLPTTTVPTPPSLVQTFKDLAAQSGIDKIQASITDLKAQQDALAAQTRTNVSAERGKPVAMNVIEGRVSEQTRQAQEQMDFIGRQLSRKVDEFNSAMANVKMIMDFTQTDYQNASQAYDRQFNQAISTINLVRGIQQDQKTDAQRAIDNARANAQIFVNSLKDGGIDINSLSPDAKAQLNKLEVQSGLPVGFFAAIKKDPKADIISTSEYRGQIQVLMRNPDGSIGVKTYGTIQGGAGAKFGSAAYTATLIPDATQIFDMNKNSYGHVSPQVWSTIRSLWMKDGGSAKSFIDNFKQYTDPNRKDFEASYGFSKNVRSAQIVQQENTAYYNAPTQ